MWCVFLYGRRSAEALLDESENLNLNNGNRVTMVDGTPWRAYSIGFVHFGGVPFYAVTT